MLMNDVRQEILQDVLAQSGRMTVPMVEGSPNLVPYVFAHDEAAYLYLVNGALDAADGVSLRCCSLSGTYAVSVLPSRGTPAALTLRLGRERCMLPLTVGPMESALVTLRRIGG